MTHPTSSGMVTPLFIETLSHLERKLDSRYPPWLNTLRHAAFSSVLEEGFPTSKDEEWRYTRLSPILSIPFQPSQSGMDHFFSCDAITQLAGNFSSTRLVFVNGHFIPSLSSQGVLKSGVRIESLGSILSQTTTAATDKADALSTRPLKARWKEAPSEKEDVESPLSRLLSESIHHRERHSAFTSLNLALTEDGAFIYIPPDTTLEEPIHLVFLSDTGTPSVSNPRSVILAGANSQATIIEVYTGILDHLYFTNAVTDILLEEGAKIEHYKVQNETCKSFHVALLNVRQERESQFSSHLTAIGGTMGRHEVRVALTGENAATTLNGLYLPQSGQHSDNPVVVTHHAPRCRSKQFYKGVVDGEGRGGFYGRIIVRQDAIKTDAQQSNKVLLLSESAQADTRPRLEILADDVQCAHGATVGQLDEEALFYLRSRGIPLNNARGILTYAFVSEILHLVRVQPLQSYLTELVLSRFSVTV